MTFKSLEKAWNEAKLKSEREHVTPYIWKNSDQKGGHIFKALSVSYPKDYSSYRMTLDYQRDLDL
ncbi:spore coat protein, partial [Vibrio parahaemolyticus]